MIFRTYLLFCLLFATLCVSAQDKIYRTNGKVIEAKVKSVENNTVTYIRSDNPDGPSYTIVKGEVEKIVYQNGSVDNFSGGSGGNSKRDKGHKRLGNNFLSLAPAIYTFGLDGQSLKDPGIGICYERLLDKDGHIGFVLPVVLNFTQKSDFYYYSYGSNNSTDKSYHSMMFMPGVKFYPAKAYQKVRYALGVSLFTMFGSEPYWAYDQNNTGTSPQGDWHYTMYGLIVSNSVNISVTPKFYMALDVNAGIPFFDNRFRDMSTLDGIVSPLMQIALKTGYRF